MSEKKRKRSPCDTYTVPRLCEVCGAAFKTTPTWVSRGMGKYCSNRCRGLVTGHAPKSHGHARTRTHRIWCGMRVRCNNPNHPAFSYYGGRGVTVCRRWDHFENFLSDMGECPSGLSIDRIDNDGNYEPSNCRWATKAQQARNTSVSIRLGAFGETKPILDWMGDPRCIVKSKATLYQRHAMGWPGEKILTTPRLTWKKRG